MKKIITCSILVIALYITSCTNRKWEDIHPKGQPVAATCDSAGIISYGNQIKPMLTNSCKLSPGSGCHDVTGSGGMDYTTPANVQYDGLSGLLMARLRKPPGPSTHMPQGEGYLPICDTAKFRNWVKQGAPINN